MFASSCRRYGHFFIRFYLHILFPILFLVAPLTASAQAEEIDKLSVQTWHVPAFGGLPASPFDEAGGSRHVKHSGFVIPYIEGENVIYKLKIVHYNGEQFPVDENDPFADTIVQTDEGPEVFAFGINSDEYSWTNDFESAFSKGVRLITNGGYGGDGRGGSWHINRATVSANTVSDQFNDAIGTHAAITGEALISIEIVDVEVSVSSSAENKDGVHIETITVQLENKGRRDAEDVKLTASFDVPGSDEMTSGLPPEMHLIEAVDLFNGGVPCELTPFSGGELKCEGLTVEGRHLLSGNGLTTIELKLRVLNKSDLVESLGGGSNGFRMTITAEVPLDTIPDDNEDHTNIVLSFSGGGSSASTEAALREALQGPTPDDPYFDFNSITGLERVAGKKHCDVYAKEIVDRFQAIELNNPEVLSDYSYGLVTTGDTSLGVDFSSGHSGTVVYPKGTDYRQTGVIIHGTPAKSRFGPGTTNLNPNAESADAFYVTPIADFPGEVNAMSKAVGGCGFEGVYSNGNDDSDFGPQTRPSCSFGLSTAATGQVSVGELRELINQRNADAQCFFGSEAVNIETKSPVDLIITNPQGQVVETLGGKIVTQELDSGIHSMAFPHEDGTHEWLLVLPQDDYDVKLMGIGDGPYTLTMTTFDEENLPVDVVIEGTAATGVEETFRVEAAHLVTEDPTTPSDDPDPSDDPNTPSDDPTTPNTDSGSSSGGGGSFNLLLLLALSGSWIARRRGERQRFL